MANCGKICDVRALQKSQYSMAWLFAKICLVRPLLPPSSTSLSDDVTPFVTCLPPHISGPVLAYFQVTVFTVDTSTALLERLESLQTRIIEGNVRLIILDSIAALARRVSRKQSTFVAPKTRFCMIELSNIFGASRVGFSLVTSLCCHFQCCKI